MEQILQKFQDIFEVAVVQDKSKELLAVENLTIESHTLLIIRLCEDLLTITRNLRETWCLGSIKVDNSGETKGRLEDEKAVFEKFNALTSRIVQLEERTQI